MMKRLFAVALCLMMLFASLGVNVNAEDTESEEMKTQCAKIHRRTLYNTGRSSMSGMCGLMAGYQLWLLDATKSPEVYNGNEYFDIYAGKDYTSMGNKVRTYSVDTYTLEEALYTVTGGGTRDVYNLIACFQWTNTKAGNRFGHVVVIHAILDGLVYFTEGFYTSIGGREGTPIVCTMEEFEALYSDWTRYEGLVVLGKRDYTDYCTFYGTDLFICADAAALLSQPCSIGSNNSAQLRRTGKNETFRTTGIYKNDQGQLYYCVKTDGSTAYIRATDATIQTVNADGVLVQPQIAAVQAEQPWQLGGNILTAGSVIHSMTAVVSRADGSEVARTKLHVGSRMFELSRLNEFLCSTCCGNDTYTLRLTAQVENYTPEGEQLYIQRQNVTVWQTQLNLLTGEMDSVAVSAAEGQMPDGWYWDGQSRYYYRNGTPRTGWFCDNGADYYFKEDGSATTGWATINGYARYFTEAGVMRTGWVETERGWHYMRSNGAAVSGFCRIGEKVYYFDETYTLLTRCTVMVDDVLYVIDTNGVVMNP